MDNASYGQTSSYYNTTSRRMKSACHIRPSYLTSSRLHHITWIPIPYAHHAYDVLHHTTLRQTWPHHITLIPRPCLNIPDTPFTCWSCFSFKTIDSVSILWLSSIIFRKNRKLFLRSLPFLFSANIHLCQTGKKKNRKEKKEQRFKKYLFLFAKLVHLRTTKKQ